MTGISESVLFQMNVLKYIDNELFKKKLPLNYLML